MPEGVVKVVWEFSSGCMCTQNSKSRIDRFWRRLKGVALLSETPNCGSGASPHTEEVLFKWGVKSPINGRRGDDH
jgi:hypothetical protein